MRRKERREISRRAKKRLKIIEAKKRKLGVSDEVKVFKTYLSGRAYYIKKGYKIAPITIVGFMWISLKYDGLSVSIGWKGKKLFCVGFRDRRDMKRVLKIKSFRFYV